MAKTLFEKAVTMYNNIMESIGYEHNTIGTCYSEDTDDWNLRDLVAECDYTLSCYYEDGHCNCDMRYSDEPEERKMWRNETARLKRFIDRYEPLSRDIKCKSGHCSQYDR